MFKNNKEGGRSTPRTVMSLNKACDWRWLEIGGVRRMQPISSLVAEGDGVALCHVRGFNAARAQRAPLVHVGFLPRYSPLSIPGGSYEVMPLCVNRILFALPASKSSFTFHNIQGCNPIYISLGVNSTEVSNA